MDTIRRYQDHRGPYYIYNKHRYYYSRNNKISQDIAFICATKEMETGKIPYKEDKLNEKQDYYDNNYNKRNEPMEECEYCGISVTKTSIYTHFKTKSHINNYLDNI